MKTLFSGSTLFLFGLFLTACGGGEGSPGGSGSGAGSSNAGESGVAGSPSSNGGGGNGAGNASSGSANAGTMAGGMSGGPAGGGGGSGGGPSQAGIPDGATVVLFLVDGLQTATLETGMANGADNMKFLVDNGVTAEASYSTSPAARLQLPDNSQPWGNATSGNVAVHTGCHLNESHMMDDIFLATQAAGIKNVFSGGDANYVTFDSPDNAYASNMEDSEVVQHAIDHLNADGVRLMRLHFQRIRDFWTGPAGETMGNSTYVQHLVEVDGLLGQLRDALEQKGVWDKTYVILSSDHGMGTTNQSGHTPDELSSWKNVTVFYGPGVKKGATIPYAELPDLAVMTNHLLKLPALKGHTDPGVTLTHKGPTGTLLTNIFEGETEDVQHPRYVEKYLNTGTYMDGGTGYADYRTGMLELLK